MICAARRSNAQQFGWLTKCHLEPCWINQCWWYFIWRWYPISMISFKIYFIDSIFCFSCSCKTSTLIYLSNPSKVFFLYLKWFCNFSVKIQLYLKVLNPICVNICINIWQLTLEWLDGLVYLYECERSEQKCQETAI